MSAVLPNWRMPYLRSADESARRPTVLCVDDDPDVTRLIEILLSNYDVDVIRDVHGQQGVWDAIRRRPDLIVTDLLMPHGNGEQLLECVKQNRQTASIPVIVLSGQRGEHVAAHVLRLGAAQFLRKPVYYLELLEAVGEHIELRELDGRPSTPTAWSPNAA